MAKQQDQQLTFEQALAGLEKSASDILRTDVTLEETIENFEKGIDYYNKCNEILEKAEQKIINYKNK